MSTTRFKEMEIVVEAKINEEVHRYWDKRLQSEMVPTGPLAGKAQELNEANLRRLKLDIVGNYNVGDIIGHNAKDERIQKYQTNREYINNTLNMDINRSNS